MAEEEAQSNLGEMIERVTQIVVRRRWWIIMAVCLTPIATIAALSLIPDRYTSEATLVVVQQQVPQRYVVPNDTTSMAVALEAMKQEILSRQQLQRIVQEFGLYPQQSKRLAPEEITKLMLRDIGIEPLTSDPMQQRDLNSFRISFITENPVVAQQVTSKLTSLFIQENLKTREEQASNTTSFLHDHVETAKRILEAQEQRLRDFKMQYLGELPEQQQGNLGVLSSLQSQLQNTGSGMSRAQEQRVYLESLLSGYQAMAAQNVALPTSPTGAPVRSLTPLETAQNEVDRLQTQKASLLVRFTPQHPDVIRISHDLEAAQVTLQRLKAAAAAKAAPAGEPQVARQPANGVENPAVAQLKSQLEANRVEVANLTKEQDRLKAAMAQYQSRLNLTPVREQQLTGLLRDYDLQKKDYEDLVNKELQSQLATNLEKNQGGRQFRLVDPPSLPVVPTSPKRLKINLGGLAGGVVLGLALAFWMELRDRSFHTEKDLGQEFAAPIVVSIPLIFTQAEERRRNRSRTLQWIAASAMLIVVSAMEFYAQRPR